MHNTVIKQGRLCEDVIGNLLVIPKPLERNDIIVAAHKYIGHRAFKKTLLHLKETFYWESMSFDDH